MPTKHVSYATFIQMLLNCKARNTLGRLSMTDFAVGRVVESLWPRLLKSSWRPVKEFVSFQRSCYAQSMNHKYTCIMFPRSILFSVRNSWRPCGWLLDVGFLPSKLSPRGTDSNPLRSPRMWIMNSNGMVFGFHACLFDVYRLRSANVLETSKFWHLSHHANKIQKRNLFYMSLHNKYGTG